jgi:hypothetical protein
MRVLTALLVLSFFVLLARPLPVTAQPKHDHEWFPADAVFRAPVADPAQPRMFMSKLKVKRDPGTGGMGEFDAAFLGVGYDFGLLRRSAASPDHGWQLSVFGSVDSLFNLDLPGDALVNADYRFGLPLTWRNGPLSTRARLYHQSSHLGDELILGGNAPRRVELSFEAVDLLVAWERSGWRLYGGGGIVFRSSTEAYDGGSLHAGFDYVSGPVLFGQRLTAGVDVKWLEPADWRSGVSAKAGVKFGRQTLERRGVSLLFAYYDGFAPFGQFFVEDLKYRGLNLQFDL